MHTIKNITLSNFTLINLFISLLPFTIILGNLAINVNIIIISILGLYLYKFDIFYLKNKIYQYLFYTFFLFVIFTTAINNIPNFNINDIYEINFFKSISFLRFLIIFLIINKLMEDKEFNLILFFYSSAFFSTIVSIDIIIQVIFGKNILGFPITSYRPSSFFGTEHIAGWYIQKFSLFLIFLIIGLNRKLKFYNTFVILIFLMFFIPLILTGNRMPAALSLLSFVLYLLIDKKFFQLLLTLIFTFFIIFTILKNPIIERIDTQLRNFYVESKNIFTLAPKLFFNENYTNEIHSQNNYLLHFNSGVQIWKKNKIIGNGIKSMPLNCIYKNYQTCNTHPHNYFIQLLMETGIIGLILIYSIFFYGLYNYLVFYLNSNEQKYKYFSFPFFLIIFFEFFPFRSTGSFFTTNTSVVIFLSLAIFINSEKIKKLKNFYKV